MARNSQNLAARAGRWSAQHWKTATGFWLAFVAVAVVLGQLAGTHKLSDSERAKGESARAQRILASAGSSLTVGGDGAWTAHLSWRMPMPYASVQVMRDGRLVDSVDATDGYTDHLLWPDTSYDYEVRWVNEIGGVIATAQAHTHTPSASGRVDPFFPTSRALTQPISVRATVAVDSSRLVSHSIAPYVATANMTVSDAWGIPIAYADPSTRSYAVACLLYWCNVTVGRQPIPQYARQSTGSDGHLAVISGTDGTELDMWQAQRPNAATSWSAGALATFATSGSGVACSASQSCSSATASGFALTAGIVRPEEIAQGRIAHALAITVPAVRSQIVACPATRTDGVDNSSLALPEGSRIQLSPAIDVSRLGLPRWEIVIARALQVYGAYVVDRGGSLGLRAESNLDRGYDAWAKAGVPKDGLLAGIPWSAVRVLVPPSSC